MPGPWTLADWNAIIQQVNQLAQNPDAGCNAVAPLSAVTAPHRWAKSDIRQVQNKLKEICKDNTFTGIPDLWKQSIIDEINSAIAHGWCCECPDQEISTILSVPETFNVFLYPHVCYQPDPCAGVESPAQYFDYFTFAQSVTGFGVGFGGAYQIVRIRWRDDVATEIKFCYGNTFNKDTGEQNPMPPPEYDPEGHLLYSDYYPTTNSCFSCSLFVWSCFIFWCSCSPCVIGAPRCCATIPTIAPCDCAVDEGYVASVNQSYAAALDEVNHSHKTTFELRKFCSPG